MRLEQLAIADGRIEYVRTSLTDAEVLFKDWQDVLWRLRFPNALAVENLNIEGEDLDRIEIRHEDDYIRRVRELVDEPDADVRCYVFMTAWKAHPRLRIVAGDCEVSRGDREPAPSGRGE